MMTRMVAFLVFAGVVSCLEGAASVPDLLTVAHKAEATSGEILIKVFRSKVAKTIAEELGALSIERIKRTKFFLIRLKPGTDEDAVIDVLAFDRRVDEAGRNHISETPEGNPSDLATLGSDALAAIPAQSPLAALGFGQAHAVATGAGQIVAVVDTGIDFSQPFFEGALLGGFDFVDNDGDPTDTANGLDDDGDGFADDQFGHGTFVASLVCAAAPNCHILPVRVLDAEGRGTAVSVANGIIWATDHGATVINLSIGIGRGTSVVREGVKYARNHNVLVVAAAGNHANDRIVYPARFSEVLAVAAVEDATVAAFSNVGSAVDLVAPGVDLLGAVPVSLSAQTATWSGTSFATPIVAGAAALVREAFPAFAWDDVIDRLVATATNVDQQNPGIRDEIGGGLLNAAAAVGG